MNKPLTPTMKRAIKYIHGQKSGELVRYPGGYWAAPDWIRWKMPWFGTPTIQALVDRGLAEYTEWKEGRAGRFPVAVSLTYIAENMAKTNHWTYEEMGI